MSMTPAGAWRPEAAREAGAAFASADGVALSRSFSDAQERVLHTLLGLKRTYCFGFKWLDVPAERLPLRPADLVPRIGRRWTWSGCGPSSGTVDRRGRSRPPR